MITAAGQYTNPVQDASGCAYNEVLELAVNAVTPDEVTPLTICEEELPYDWNGQVITAAGQYTNPVQDASGCAYNEVLELAVNTVTPDAVEDVIICTEELPYEWRGQSITVAGTYTNPIQDARGCATEEILNLEVNDVTQDEVEERIVCEAELPFTWNGQTVSTGGTYTNNISDTNGCELSQILNVTVSALEISGTTVEPTCNPSNGLQNGEIRLTVTGDTNNASYTWSTQDGSGLNTSAMNQTNLGSGIYTVTVTNGQGCEAIESFTLTLSLIHI